MTERMIGGMTGMLYLRMKQKCLLILTVLFLGIISTGYDTAYAADAVKTLPSDEVEKIIKEYVIQNTPWTEEQVKIKNVNVANKINLPESWSYHIAAAPASSMTGRSSFLLDITGTDNAVQSSW